MSKLPTRITAKQLTSLILNSRGVQSRLITPLPFQCFSSHRQLNPVGIRVAQSLRFNSTKTPEKAGKPVGSNSKDLTPSTNTAVETEATVAKKTLWEKVKHEAQHYWDGTKLLGLEIKISSKLLIKMASGYELTRREYRQLQRTISDVLRLFPFAMFVLIPFAELLLPVALKLFPNLLPSTYESKLDKEKKAQLLRNTRRRVSEVLKNTRDKVKVPMKNISEEQRTDFKNFYSKIKSAELAPTITKEEILKVAKLFKDDLVLDNASRGTLIAMAKYINIKPYGTDQILRYRIRHRMLKIKEDDRAIDYEGVASLTVPELKMACASRGIKVYSASPDQMRGWLSGWLDMRLRERIPSTLMILVNAYNYGETDDRTQYDALKAVLTSLPQEFYHEQELQVEESHATFQQRMNVVKEQEHLIKSENVQEKEHVVSIKDKLSLDDPEEDSKTEEGSQEAAPEAKKEEAEVKK